MMVDDEQKPEVCRQVWDGAVEGRDVMGDAALAAHVGSCMTCFRTLAELRDAPRVAAALRADAPTPPVSDRFWDDLAARTTAAAAGALADSKRRPIWRMTGVAAIVVAAAAAWVLFAGRAPVGSSAGAPGSVASTAGGEEEETGDEGAATDIQDLDEPALQRLLARLRAQAPANVNALAVVGDALEASDVVFDEEGQLNDELAELDGPALLRVERSLAGTSL
jgi:hypothetical protein